MAAFFVGVMEQRYQVYVLQNDTGKFYIGLSENVANRLKQHNSGESKWTNKQSLAGSLAEQSIDLVGCS